MKRIKDPVQPDGRYSNLGLLDSLGAVSSLVPDGACFGDKTCQQNRAAQTQAQQTAAQAQLLTAQNQAKATQSQTTIIVIVAVTFVVLAAVGGFIYLKSKKAV
jgi:cobalamin biosynthesis Mg chelatase CobN